MVDYVSIQHQLEITPGNKIVIPGCEPTSSLSSSALSYNLSQFGCNNALIDLDQALSAIPGSYIKWGSNYNRGNTRQKWYVLPTISTDCPCASYDDYYAILKSLSANVDPVDESYDYCDMNNMGYCPSPDFDQLPAPQSDIYQSEGSFPGDVGILPPVPPWGTSGT